MAFPGHANCNFYFYDLCIPYFSKTDQSHAGSADKDRYDAAEACLSQYQNRSAGRKQTEEGKAEQNCKDAHSCPFSNTFRL